MDPITAGFLMSVAAGISANAATKVGEKLIDVAKASPRIQKLLRTDPVKALDELAGQLEVLAGSGEISIDGAQITALRHATFDHQHGLIAIGNAHVKAPFVQTGGTGRGTTEIGGNTVLESQGTSIKVGKNASIKITGDASIKQS